MKNQKKPVRSAVAAARHRPGTPLAMLLMAAMFSACGDSAHFTSDESEPIAECDAYATAYERCLGAVTRDAETVRSLAASTRSALRVAPTDAAARTQRREACGQGLHNLALSCPGSTRPESAPAQGGK